MSKQTQSNQCFAIFTEIEEFAGFSIESQQYIRRSLDVASGETQAIERWLDSPRDRGAIPEHMQVYRFLDQLRVTLGKRTARQHQGAFLRLLIELSSFDLGNGDLDGFAPYRFLYERLLGSRARPWLPSAFCAAVLMPQVKPMRRVRLLSTLGDAVVAPWSEKEPSFHPELIAA